MTSVTNVEIVELNYAHAYFRSAPPCWRRCQAAGPSYSDNRCQQGSPSGTVVADGPIYSLAKLARIAAHSSGQRHETSGPHARIVIKHTSRTHETPHALTSQDSKP